MKATLSAKASESNIETQEELTRQMDRICKVATSKTFYRKQIIINI